MVNQMQVAVGTLLTRAPLPRQSDDVTPPDRGELPSDLSPDFSDNAINRAFSNIIELLLSVAFWVGLGGIAVGLIIAAGSGRNPEKRRNGFIGAGVGFAAAVITLSFSSLFNFGLETVRVW